MKQSYQNYRLFTCLWESPIVPGSLFLSFSIPVDLHSSCSPFCYSTRVNLGISLARVPESSLDSPLEFNDFAVIYCSKYCGTSMRVERL